MSIKRAKELRKNQTDAEKRLWHHLRNRGLAGFKFRRQYPIEPYIVDFVCLDKRLVVEVDGGQHSKQKAYERERTRSLQEKGFHLLRFWNHAVLTETDAVLQTIRAALLDDAGA